MISLACGISVLIVVAVIMGLLSLTKRTEPAGCIAFFVVLFLFCLAGLIIPQLFYQL